ncbi:MAG: carbohydrate ABC transporter permease [Clostridiales bacterium]|jgi:raffinose/stachyose/melibiose transport system permease protein|nr:carbohydrate ABC transporter permease [Clostridiales bacterium]MDR2752641.1 carbohydrate ABC transporter permease [Clostridiales bacterium]
MPIFKKIRQAAKEVAAWLASLAILIPFLIVVFNSLKTKGEAVTMSLTPPTELHWENFKKVWELGDIPQAYMNSFLASSGAVIASVVFASVCGYTLSRRRDKINNALYVYFSLGLMFPVNMVTVVKVIRTLGLYNNRFGVILLFVSLLMPMSVFLYYGFISGVPRELDEAAVVDGAGALRVFFQIIFPAIKPVTVTVVMLNFLGCWNDFTIPLYLLPDPDKEVIVQKAYHFYGTFVADWNLVSVSILYAIAPVVVVFLCAQKYVISGMAAGAVKG